jgi:[protein-PII] uridylyltransferase
LTTSRPGERRNADSGGNGSGRKLPSGADDSGRKLPSGADDSGRKLPSGADDSGRKLPSGLDDSGRKLPSGADDSGRKLPSGADDSGRKLPSGADDSGRKLPSGLDDSGRKLPSLTEVRAAVLRRPDLAGSALRDALAETYDHWIRQLFAQAVQSRGSQASGSWAGSSPGDVSGIALVAVGGYGRNEIAPFSDMDLVLVHDGRNSTVDRSAIAKIADAIWYPIWDSDIGLDHSVRTIDQALSVAKSDLKAMVGLLDTRHIAGDASLGSTLRERALLMWRAEAHSRMPALHESVRERWAVSGEAAFLLEPNLKECRGALRDWQVLRALSRAQLIVVGEAVLEAHNVLLDVRGELHRHVGRASDVLRQQDQGAVAAAAGYADADTLLHAVNDAARTIAHASDLAWRRVDRPAPARRMFGLLSRRQQATTRRPLADGVVEQDGEVVLALDADPWVDPGLMVRAARAAVVHDLPLAPFAVERLASESAPMPVPWPSAVLADFVGVLDGGAAGTAVLESLDQAGLLVRLIPEWEHVRSKAQHNPVHLFTVDRHLMETAAQASLLTRMVSRPDLLLLGALMHDIGKGFPGDHSVVGEPIAAGVARRIGLSADDIDVVAALTRHHLLLPDTATRRDSQDPVTMRIVTDVVGDSGEMLDLLHALTIADAAATGPAAWSDWKAGLVTTLVRRVRAAMAGGAPPRPLSLDARRVALAEAGAFTVDVDGQQVVVAALDSPGLLSRTSGVFALHSLDVRSASVATHSGMAVNSFTVAPRFGRLPDAAVLRTDLKRALDGTLPLAERLSAKERAYERADSRNPPPRVLWFDEATDATVLELRAADSIGLLHRVTASIEQCGLDIRSAMVATLGASVVDSFYVTGRDGKPIDADETRQLVSARVLEAVSAEH